MTAKQMRRKKPINKDFLNEILPLTDNQKNVFKDWGYEKEYDLMIGGATFSKSLLGQHYPLRDRMVKILQKMSNLGYRIYQHPHPGYEHTDAHTDNIYLTFQRLLTKQKFV